MPRRREPDPMRAFVDSVQLNGFVARFDGICHKCREEYLAKQTRILPVPGRPDRYMHVTCAAGQDET